MDSTVDLNESWSSSYNVTMRLVFSASRSTMMTLGHIARVFSILLRYSTPSVSNVRVAVGHSSFLRFNPGSMLMNLDFNILSRRFVTVGRESPVSSASWVIDFRPPAIRALMMSTSLLYSFWGGVAWTSRTFPSCLASLM